MNKQPLIGNDHRIAKPSLILPAHHSVSDWDLSPGITYTLDPTMKISDPKSLRLGGDGELRDALICKIATTLLLPEGRLVTWHYRDEDAESVDWYFRHQHTGFTPFFNNHYWVKLDPTEWILYRVVDMVANEIGRQPKTSGPNIWGKDRVTWWNSKTPAGDDALAVMVEIYQNGGWSQNGEWIYDTENQWKASETNKVGIGTYELPGGYCWLDDTEVWGPI